MPRTAIKQSLLVMSAVSLLASCGGGGGGSTPSVITPPSPPPVTGPSTPAVPTYTANEYPPSSELKNLCETVRTGVDLDGDPRPDQQGERLHELFWLRSWMDETYLYFDQVTDRDPTDFTDIEAYFDERLTTAVAEGGRPVDRFSFLQSTEEFEANRSGDPVFGYGAVFSRIRTNQLPRDWRVAFTQDGSPAEEAGFTRGVRILTIDGVDFLSGNSNSDIDTILDGLFPDTVGEEHVFEVERPDGTRESLTLTSTSLTVDPVNEVRVIQDGARQVGYIHYHTFSPFTGEAQLFDAFTELSNAGVDDVVLDFRYNGGGLLFLAAQIGYMVAGPTSANQTFYRQEFNARSPNRNPLNGEVVDPIPFIDETVGFSLEAGQDLPSLDLPRVIILTTGQSCSASEAVLNGLNGIGVDVIQIGGRTCGKSTGQIPTENCGFTFLPLHFRGVNAQGFGDYEGGFAPNQVTGAGGPVIPGCSVSDDLANPLGDSSEAMLAAALQYARSGDCPSATAAGEKGSAPLSQSPDSASDRVFVERDNLMDNPRMKAFIREAETLDMTRPPAFED